MGNRGTVLSGDIHDKKLSRIRSGAQALGLDLIRTAAMDARDAGKIFPQKFDLVLADVPCSGLGVIRKKPEIRYKDPESLRTLPQIQLDILRSLACCVKPGGVLMYSTCTLLEAENESVCKTFLAENPAFSAESFTLPDPIGKVDSGIITIWPQKYETDGFFLCKMRRSI